MNPRWTASPASSCRWRRRIARTSITSTALRAGRAAARRARGPLRASRYRHRNAARGRPAGHGAVRRACGPRPTARAGPPRRCRSRCTQACAATRSSVWRAWYGACWNTPECFAYLTIVFFAFVEGEIYYSKVCADAMAGKLNWAGVWCAGALGGSLGDQFWFYLLRGRIHWLDRYPRLAKYRDAVSARVHSHETLMILSGRFLPGLRTAIPVACAYANVQPLKFSTLNLVERLRLGRRDHAVRQARIECPVRVRSRRVVGPADPGADGDSVLPLAQPAATREGQSAARRLTTSSPPRQRPSASVPSTSSRQSATRRHRGPSSARTSSARTRASPHHAA